MEKLGNLTNCGQSSESLPELTKVLVAEDDNASRIALSGLLKKWGYDVVEAASGVEAWNHMTSGGAPRLALLDWMMPEMDGLELCERLRTIPGDDPLYLILLTGRSECEDLVRGLNAGADDFMAKPYNPAELKARLTVGRRILQLQFKALERERMKGALEMAGAVCHEMNQPLQAATGLADLLLMDLGSEGPLSCDLIELKNEVLRMGVLTKQIMNITKYRSKRYLKETRIVDISGAAEKAKAFQNLDRKLEFSA